MGVKLQPNTLTDDTQRSHLRLTRARTPGRHPPVVAAARGSSSSAGWGGVGGAPRAVAKRDGRRRRGQVAVFGPPAHRCWTMDSPTEDAMAGREERMSGDVVDVGTDRALPPLTTASSGPASEPADRPPIAIGQALSAVNAVCEDAQPSAALMALSGSSQDGPCSAARQRCHHCSRRLLRPPRASCAKRTRPFGRPAPQTSGRGRRAGINFANFLWRK